MNTFRERFSRRMWLAALFLFFCGRMFVVGADESPLALDSDNPRYFHFRGKTVILVTSGEHYGALLNGDFDFETYFKTLAADGFNLTRVFSGVYCEPVGAFKIEQNTLAPATGRFIAPFARSDSPGYANGGNKFDLTRWNTEYFKRLHALMQSASANGIVVEFVFFCPFYKDNMWELSPLNPDNHIEPLPIPKRPNDVWSIKKSGPYLAIQELWEKSRLRILAEGERVWLLYLSDTGKDHAVRFDLDLPPGSYVFIWIDPVSGGIVKAENHSQDGKQPISVLSPKLPEDLVLKIMRKKKQ